MPIVLTANGKASLGTFRGTPQTLQLMKQYALGPEGEQNFRVRQWTEAIVRDVAPKDYLSEILALHGWAKSPVIRYTNDALHVEQVKSPARMLTEIEKTGKCLCDCDEVALLLATMGLVLGREAEFVTVGFSSADVYTHVFTRLMEPRSHEWILVDTVAGTRDAEMANKVLVYKFYPVDS